jgi:hypothetical protein
MAGGLGAGTSGYTRVTERILRGAPGFVSKHEGVPKAWQGIAVRDLVGDRVLDELSVGKRARSRLGVFESREKAAQLLGIRGDLGEGVEGWWGELVEGVSHELRTSRLTFAPAIATAICE